MHRGLELSGCTRHAIPPRRVTKKSATRVSVGVRRAGSSFSGSVTGGSGTLSACNPSDKLPKLTFTLRAVYNFSKDNYDKNAAYNVMKWILSPPEAQAANDLAMRRKK